MTDQQLGLALALPTVVAPPLVGFWVGSRISGRIRAAITAVIVSGLTGMIAGAGVAVAVDLWAPLMTAGNPWIGHPHGVSLSSLVLGGSLGGGAGTMTGVVSGVLVWRAHRWAPTGPHGVSGRSTPG